jgi:hypothetical protein
MRRALLAASKGFDIGTSLDDTLAANSRRSGIKTGAERLRRQDLAKIQFASALANRRASQQAASTDLEAAARLLNRRAAASGSWQFHHC